MEVVVSLLTLLLLYIMYSSKLQFSLSVGIIGVIYLVSTITYAVCNILAGVISDKLVSFPIYFAHVATVNTVDSVYLPRARMRKGVKQSVLSVCLSVCQSVE